MAMSEGADILYLNADDVLGCAVTPAEMNAAVEQAFLASACGEARTRPALSMMAGPGASFRAKGAVLGTMGYAAVKWYGYFPQNTARGRAEYCPLILLNETRAGFPVAMIEATWITAVRTAAIVGVGARWLASGEAQRATFVGCGVQARAALEALLPGSALTSAVALSRRRESAEAFADFARQLGVETEVSEDPRRALAQSDIVVTSVPRQSPRTGFLDAGWLKPGAFVAMVDYGVSWKAESLAQLNRCFADDAEQAAIRAEHGDVVVSFAAGLADVIGRAKPGRLAPEERIALLVSGTGLADAAAAALVYERARALGLGQSLSLCGTRGAPASAQTEVVGAV
ncbi:MAG TPA: ornithine cyclodeaminase family protein [Pseudolabrys sp.]|nr:ornithine cyclodeaminase family protein [Pseudolabrys sp.]